MYGIPMPIHKPMVVALLMLYRTIIVAIYLLLVAYNCVTCCENQCYRPEGVETLASSIQSEDDLINNGICYSSCALNLQTYQIENFYVVNTSALNCSQQRQLNGCITGCNTTAKTSNSCQQLCSACQVSDVTDCSSCSYSACMIGCNATASTTNRNGINVDTINVTLVPVPGQPYVYKASVEGNNNIDDVSASTATSDLSAFIIRVSTNENNLTTYNLLHDPSTDYIDLLQYTHHCNLAEVSVAVVDSNGVSEYSPATEICISAIYPKAPTGLQACFGEKLVHDSSEQWIINLKWDLPEDKTHLQGFELNIASAPTDKGRCRRTSYNSTFLDKDQISYTLGLQEEIVRNCNYQITLTSLPKNDGNNSIMTDLNANVPNPICSIRFPQYNYTLIRQYNNTGRSHYFLNVELQSDPAALQALSCVDIAIESHRRFCTPAKQFPQLLIPFPNTTTTDNYGLGCFSDKNRVYTCSENCNSLQYSGSQYDRCIEDCEYARHYTIPLGSFLTNVSIVIHLDFQNAPDYNYRCLYNQIRIHSFEAICFSPTIPRNFNYTHEIQQGISNVLLVNFTWDVPEITHGEIHDYFIEYITNDTSNANDTTTSDITLETRIFKEIFQNTLVRVRANNRCGYSNWSTPILINLTAFFPTTSASSDDDTPYHRYYIATGVIVGCMVFAAVVLAIIVICCCYVHRETKKDKIYIDESSIIGMLHRNANRTSTIMDDELPTDLSTDLWEMSPDNIFMDETTFFGCGNFGEVYKGCLKVATKSPSELYPAGKTVAVKILQEGAGGELKHDFLQEISLMKKVAQDCNPFVVNMIGCCTRSEPLALIMEFVSGGNLLEFLKSHRRKRAQSITAENKAAPYLEPISQYSHLKSKEQQEDENKKPLTIVDQLTFAYQIACGMEYLSGKGIVHRDLACRNILVGDQNNMKIADFGLSKHLYDDPVYVKNQDGKLPIRWMAIEAILERKYSVQSDVWSFGIVIWELITFGSYPYPSLTNIEVVDALLKGFRMECPEDYVCPPELYALAERCWDVDPELRPSFNMMATEINKMIPDYDPNQYVEIARFPPYCEMHSTDYSKERDYEQTLDRGQNNS